MGSQWSSLKTSVICWKLVICNTTLAAVFCTYVTAIFVTDILTGHTIMHYNNLVSIWTDTSSKLDFHQVSSAPSVKIHRNPSLHLFWECQKSKVFWNEVIKWLGTCNFSWLLTKSLLPQLCLGFVDDTTALLLHHALLIARYHIFGAKSMHHLPSLELFIRNFLTCLEVERRFAQKTGS